MRSINIVAVAALAAVAGGCASDPYYARSNSYHSPSYAYSPGYVYAPSPAYTYAPPPGYYRNATYYTYPQQNTPRSTYDGYWDYQRNYRGINGSPEFSSM
jgi:hypothetical protein